MKISLVYITAPDQKTAQSIARTLVEERLAACVNILDHVTSFYRWDGKINQDNEVVLIAKTRATLVKKVINKTKSMHPYECPCVVALPIEKGYGPFLDWIGKETKG